jgi:hypothetical protein
MARIIDIAGDELRIRLTGLTAVAALKRELRIPLAAIRSASTGAPRKLGVRLGGTEIPFTDIRAGRFRSRGGWSFLSFEHRDRAVTLELNGQRYDRVVVGVDDPDDLSRRLTPAS